MVGWRQGHGVASSRVQTSTGIAEELRLVADVWLGMLSDAAYVGAAYDPDDEQGDADYLTLPYADLDDPAILADMGAPAALPLATPDDLREHPPQWYGIVIGDDPAAQTVYLRRKSPVRAMQQSILGVYGDSLTRVTGPLMAFDDAIDIIVAGQQVWAFRQSALEAMFRDTPAVLANVGAWVTTLAGLLPISATGQQNLVGRLASSSVLRRKVTALLRKPHLQALTIPQVRRELRRLGLPVADYVQNGELVFDRATEKDLLLVLNEDMFIGGLSSTPYAASRKTAR